MTDPDPTAGTAQVTVVLVDDHRMFRAGVRAEIGEIVNVAAEAADVDEAVAAVLTHQPDVVLLDIGLPKLYGYDAAKRIREARGRDVLLIAITGWGQEEDRRRAFEAGFDHHMTKPVQFEGLLRLIARRFPGAN